MGRRLIRPREEIKPCPFCGHKAFTTYGVMGRVTMIICGNYRYCGATVSFDCGSANVGGENESIHLWNQRADK